MSSKIDTENELVAFQNMQHRYENNKWRKRELEISQYNVRDLIRISKAKAAFMKGYISGWSEEIF